MKNTVIPTWERQIVGRIVQTFLRRDRRGRDWTPPAHLEHENVTLEGNTGARLSARWFPHPAARGAVVLAHPDRRYGKAWWTRDGWVDFLHGHGYEAFTFDFVGYGQSHGPATYDHEDVIAAAQWTRDRTDGRPVHVIGVSLGAFAVANAAPHLPFVHGLVLESPYPDFEQWYGHGPGRWGMRAFRHAFPRTAASLQADRNLARASARRILVALAEADDVTPHPLTEAVARAAPMDRTRLLRVPDARHLEPFRRSGAYRAAVLETLNASAGRGEAPATPARAPEAR